MQIKYQKQITIIESTSKSQQKIPSSYTKQEMRKSNQLKNLKKKAFGPSSIPTVILKHFRKTISIPLTKLVNLSFDQGKFPSILKIAKVLAIFKKGDKLDANNYRPISLLSNLSKIIEKIMHKRLYFYLEQNKVFYPFLFGFRNQHCTTHALIEITEKNREASDKGLFACGVYLDFKKVFDTVNYEILLSNYNIKE